MRSVHVTCKNDLNLDILKESSSTKLTLWTTTIRHNIGKGMWIIRFLAERITYNWPWQKQYQRQVSSPFSLFRVEQELLTTFWDIGQMLQNAWTEFRIMHSREYNSSTLPFSLINFWFNNNGFYKTLRISLEFHNFCLSNDSFLQFFQILFLKIDVVRIISKTAFQ